MSLHMRFDQSAVLMTSSPQLRMAVRPVSQRRAVRCLAASAKHSTKSLTTTTGRQPGHTARCPCCVPRKRMLCRAQTTATTTTTITTSAPASSGPKVLELAVPMKDVERNIQLDVVAEGKGQAIEVVGVTPGSAAEQAGLKVGQKIRSIMDPVRSDLMYPLQDRPSLKFVTHTIAMTRRSALYITVEEPAFVPAPPAAKAAAGEVQQQGEGGAGRDATAAVLSSIDGLLGEASEGSTVAQQLTAWYSDLVAAGTITPEPYSTVPLITRVGANVPGSAAEANATSADAEATTDVQKRVKRRKDYLQEVSQRNDAPFFAGVAAAVLLPAIIILAVAYFSGYLDNLYMSTLTRLT